MTRIADSLLATGFCALLAAPSLGWLLGVAGPRGIEELRPLAPVPQVHGVPMAEFTRQAARYVEDHFGFRKHLIAAHHRFVWSVLGASPQREVIRGRDGWLFFGVAPAVEVHRRTLPPISPGVLRAWQRVLEERTEWLARRGGVYRFLIVPEKQTVYPEQMPERLRPLGRTHRLDELTAFLGAHPPTGIVDVLPALVAAKQDGLVYFATDTHWTPLGAGVVYRELVASLSRDRPVLAPRPLETLLGDPQRTPGGDLARYCALGDQLVETVRGLDPRPAFRAQVEPARPGESVRNSHHRCADAECADHAILFGDSFGDQLRAHLGEHFHELHALESHEFDVAAIEATRATVVISEIPERLAVHWLPHNPVAVRRVPSAGELASLDPAAANARGVGALELVGHRLADVAGEPELVIAWRARARTTLTGTLRVAAVGVGSLAWPQDPIASTVEAGSTWLDRLPLPAGVQELTFGLVDAGGVPLPFDGGTQTTVVCRSSR